MASRLNPKVVSFSLASVAGILYVACALLFTIAPRAAMGFFQDLFHGIDIAKIAMSSVSSGRTVTGFIEIVIISFLVGWLFAVVYNYFAKK